VRHRDESGQTTLLILGFATIVIMVVVTVINASAAYLQRQALDNLADGAAMYGADLGATGAYDEGVPVDRLDQHADSVRQAIDDYFVLSRAHQRYPGITSDVRVDAELQSVTVTVQAPLDLPLNIPGAPRRPLVGSTATAAVRVLDVP
jgi:hypothetical protein